MTSLEKAKNIAKILDKKKAIDIIGIETKELTVMSDYFIIASGTSNTHVRALADEVDDEMKKLGVEVDHIEGRATGWILLDYNDVLVHVSSRKADSITTSSVFGTMRQGLTFPTF